MISDEFDPYDEDYFRSLPTEPPCPMCKGTGEINALTDQTMIFVASYADCPLCDGTGEAP